MRKWTAKDYRTMLWKNGAGSTTELAIFPEGASLDNFVWRLSMATVAEPGAFSYFAQIDRSLAILSGDGLILQCNHDSQSEQIHTLLPSSPPFRFAGEDSIYAQLCCGSVVDLNLMTRRDICQHYMQRLFGGEHHVMANDAQQILIYCARGEANIDQACALQTGDLILLEEEQEQAGISCHIDAQEGAIVYLMRISFLSHSEHLRGKNVLG